MDKTPKLMNYSRMKDLLSSHIAEMREKSFISNELGIVHGDPSVFLMVLSQSQPPFSIDDYRLGVSLIFYIQNVVDYLKNPIKKKERRKCPVYLAALASEGKILLPVEKTTKEAEKVKTDLKNRSALIAEAKQGNQEAMQSLTFDDIDQYAVVSRRIRKEDIYSIVETSFIPYGSESDNYSILGYINSVERQKNSYTKEEFYVMNVECNEMNYDVCIHVDDLLGEPAVGRRFRGNIWMQGKVEF